MARRIMRQALKCCVVDPEDGYYVFTGRTRQQAIDSYGRYLIHRKNVKDLKRKQFRDKLSKASIRYM